VNDLSLHILSKMKVMVITDIERDEVEFICKVIHLSSLGKIASF
jgi:T-complex protein 1 subunit delta